MTSISHVPKPLDPNPPQVVERKIREVECPNPKCDQTLDITNINAGTKIECGTCKNVTWVPAYQAKWWQRAPVVIGGLLLSLAIGTAGSLIASGLWEQYKANQAISSPKVPEETKKDNVPNKRLQGTPASGRP